jgi:hypothetical protein
MTLIFCTDVRSDNEFFTCPGSGDSARELGHEGREGHGVAGGLRQAGRGLVRLARRCPRRRTAEKRVP